MFFLKLLWLSAKRTFHNFLQENMSTALRALLGALVATSATALLHGHPHPAPLRLRWRASSPPRLPPLTGATTDAANSEHSSSMSSWRAALSRLELTPFQVRGQPPRTCSTIPSLFHAARHHATTVAVGHGNDFNSLWGGRRIIRRTRSPPGWPRARRKPGQTHAPSSRATRRRLRWPTSRRGSRRRPRRYVVVPA